MGTSKSYDDTERLKTYFKLYLDLYLVVYAFISLQKDISDAYGLILMNLWEPSHDSMIAGPLAEEEWIKFWSEIVNVSVKPSLHYPSWRPELTGDGFHYPSTRAVLTGGCFH